jgi:catechol 2,3-dioxygenase-like lactoylglutathione lyase family enzyme
METSKISRRVINPGTSIGHIHLKVANIERALGFYRDILGFEVTQWYGDDAVFLSAGGYHHHIGLNTWMSRNADPAPPHSAGLFHLAILYPERRDCRALPPRHPLPRAAGPRARPQVAPGKQVPHRRNLRPRRLRGAVPAGSRRQWRRAVPGPSARGVAAYPRRRARNGNKAPRR